MLAKKGANTRDSTAMSLMRMFREGPAADTAHAAAATKSVAAATGSDAVEQSQTRCSNLVDCGQDSEPS
jgi:hypothetical protein